MNVTAPIKAIIATDIAATAAVGTRVYNSLAPQRTTYPFVVCTILGSEPNSSKDNAGDVDDMRTQVDVWGESSTQAEQAAEKVRRALDYYRGDITYKTITYSVDFIRNTSFRTLVEGSPEKFRVVLEFLVSIKRAGIIGHTPFDVSNLQYFDHMDSAIAAGLVDGDWFLLSADNQYGIPADMPMRVST